MSKNLTQIRVSSGQCQQIEDKALFLLALLPISKDIFHDSKLKEISLKYLQVRWRKTAQLIPTIFFQKVWQPFLKRTSSRVMSLATRRFVVSFLEAKLLRPLLRIFKFHQLFVYTQPWSELLFH